MPGKIILITPPDVFENSNKSVLFICLDDEDQAQVSKWLSEYEFDYDINFYVYHDEIDVKWLLYAIGVADNTYIDIDSLTDVPKTLSSYILGKRNTFYKTKDENLAAVYSYINTGRVKSIESFLERIFNE
jgi:hypothetical protein